jgi:hypothetical protein
VITIVVAELILVAAEQILAVVEIVIVVAVERMLVVTDLKESLVSLKLYVVMLIGRLTV